MFKYRRLEDCGMVAGIGSAAGLIRIGFGGGCHWCTEAVFQALIGVDNVEQGFIKSAPPHDTWSEAVVVTFDPSAIGQETLIEIHLRTHASTSSHKMRGKYRSAVYVFDEAQATEGEFELARLQSEFDEALVTNVLACTDFKLSDARFHNYYATDPERPFCRTYIDPKLAMLRERYADKTWDGATTGQAGCEPAERSSFPGRQ